MARTYWSRPARRLAALIGRSHGRPARLRREAGRLLLAGLGLALATFALAMMVRAGSESDGRTGTVATDPAFTLAVQPGWTAEQIAAALRQFGFAEAAEFPDAVCRSDNAAGLGLGPRRSPCLSGYLLPGTYRVLHGMRADDVVRMMVQNFDRRLSYDLRTRATELGLSIYDAVVLASLVESEGGNAREQMLLASVLLNRLRRGMAVGAFLGGQDRVSFDGAGPALRVDTARRGAGEGRLVDIAAGPAERPGFPSAPVGNPSLLAIRNVLFAPHSSFLYLVRNYDGSHLFAKTPQEHLDNLDRVRSAERWIKDYPAIDARFDRELAMDLQSLIEGTGGRVGIAIKSLATGQAAWINANRQFEAGSFWKLPLMVAVLREVRAGNLASREVLRGRSGTVMDALESISSGDDEGAVALGDRLGLDKVESIAENLGMTNTSLSIGTMHTTPADILRLLEAIATGDRPDERLADRMLSLLFREPVRSRLADGLPSIIPIAHKTATLPEAVHDVGIVYTAEGAYIVVVMTEGLADEANGADLISAISRLTYAHFRAGGPTSP